MSRQARISPIRIMKKSKQDCSPYKFYPGPRSGNGDLTLLFLQDSRLSLRTATSGSKMTFSSPCCGIAHQSWLKFRARNVFNRSALCIAGAREVIHVSGLRFNFIALNNIAIFDLRSLRLIWENTKRGYKRYYPALQIKISNLKNCVGCYCVWAFRNALKEAIIFLRAGTFRRLSIYSRKGAMQSPIRLSKCVI